MKLAFDFVTKGMKTIKLPLLMKLMLLIDVSSIRNVFGAYVFANPSNIKNCTSESVKEILLKMSD